MTCKDVDEILIEGGNRTPQLESVAGEHLNSCERCRSIVRWMERTDSTNDFDRRMLDTIGASLLPALKPVRPLAPNWISISAFVLLACATPVIGASFLGMHGLWAATALQRTVILSAICLGVFAAANVASREMTPGNQRHITAWSVLAGSSVVLLLIFSLLFRNYGTGNFVRSGILCLATGLCFSIGTGLLVGLLLRRGFILDAASGGLSAGTLAGLTGLGLLELHCANLSATHIIVWHLAVLAVSGAAGWLIGHTADR